MDKQPQLGKEFFDEGDGVNVEVTKAQKQTEAGKRLEQRDVAVFLGPGIPF